MTTAIRFPTTQELTNGFYQFLSHALAGYFYEALSILILTYGISLYITKHPIYAKIETGNNRVKSTSNEYLLNIQILIYLYNFGK